MHVLLESLKREREREKLNACNLSLPFYALNLSLLNFQKLHPENFSFSLALSLFRTFMTTASVAEVFIPLQLICEDHADTWKLKKEERERSHACNLYLSLSMHESLKERERSREWLHELDFTLSLSTFWNIHAYNIFSLSLSLSLSLYIFHEYRLGSRGLHPFAAHMRRSREYMKVSEK